MYAIDVNLVLSALAFPSLVFQAPWENMKKCKA